MVHIRFGAHEKEWLSKLKTKHLQLEDEFFVPFQSLRKAAEFLDPEDRRRLDGVLGEKGRVVFDRSVRSRRKVG